MMNIFDCCRDANVKEFAAYAGEIDIMPGLFGFYKAILSTHPTHSVKQK